VVLSATQQLTVQTTMSFTLSRICLSCICLALTVVASLVAAAPTNNSSAIKSSNPLVASAWYAGWLDTPLDSLSWDKYTQMTYAFATTSPDASVISLAASDEQLLPQFVSTAHQNGVKASLSIGGWTGSQWFSINVGSAANRTAFVNAVVGLVNEYNLDGIDFDWEYPNAQGSGCNVINPDDTANFLLFLQLLRRDPVGSSIVLTAATPLNPWNDASGSPSQDVSGFSEVLDYIEIMNYDVWGSWSSSVGPNAPLFDSCAPAIDQQGSADDAVYAWITAGMPLDQIVLGVPAYGHTYYVTPENAFVSGSTTQLAPYPPFEQTSTPQGNVRGMQPAVDACPQATITTGGTLNYVDLVNDGFLTTSGAVQPGIASRYDTCSQTPYVYNPQTQVMVSFDNTKSFVVKGFFIKKLGLRGFSMWQAAGDYNDELLNAIRDGVGFQNSLTSQ